MNRGKKGPDCSLVGKKGKERKQYMSSYITLSLSSVLKRDAKAHSASVINQANLGFLDSHELWTPRCMPAPWGRLKWLTNANPPRRSLSISAPAISSKHHPLIFVLSATRSCMHWQAVNVSWWMCAHLRKIISGQGKILFGVLAAPNFFRSGEFLQSTK